MDVRLRHPCSIMVIGPSGSGKTQFTMELLKSGAFDTPIQDVILCYGQWQPAYEALKGYSRFVEGLIDADQLDPRHPHLLVLDDLMTTGDKRIESFFVKDSHHYNCSTVYICQSLFYKSPGHRTCSLNAHYLILFKSPRDYRQIMTLEQQMFPHKRGYLLQSYKSATERPYGYLMIDLKGNTPDHLRLRGRILDPHSQDVYLPKDYKLTTSEDSTSFSHDAGQKYEGR